MKDNLIFHNDLRKLKDLNAYLGARTFGELQPNLSLESLK